MTGISFLVWTIAWLSNFVMTIQLLHWNSVFWTNAYTKSNRFWLLIVRCERSECMYSTVQKCWHVNILPLVCLGGIIMPKAFAQYCIWFGKSFYVCFVSSSLLFRAEVKHPSQILRCDGPVWDGGLPEARDPVAGVGGSESHWPPGGLVCIRRRAVLLKKQLRNPEFSGQFHVYSKKPYSASGATEACYPQLW